MSSLDNATPTLYSILESRKLTNQELDEQEKDPIDSRYKTDQITEDQIRQTRF
jgi:hypothetical protein